MAQPPRYNDAIKRKASPSSSGGDGQPCAKRLWPADGHKGWIIDDDDEYCGRHGGNPPTVSRWAAGEGAGEDPSSGGDTSDSNVGDTSSEEGEALDEGESEEDDDHEYLPARGDDRNEWEASEEEPSTLAVLEEESQDY